MNAVLDQTDMLDRLNQASPEEARLMLDNLYEYSPWVAVQALAARPFRSIAHLKLAMAEVVAGAGHDAQVKLIRSHPELAGKAMVSQELTNESRNEQGRSGLTHCTPEEFATLQQLNADYNAKFGFPFILAVRGPRGTGLAKQQIIETFARRLQHHPDFELRECLRNIHRVVELRLDDKFGVPPGIGQDVWDWHESLAQSSDPEFAEKGQLTVTYLTEAHRACAALISQKMTECGFDEVGIDAVGNVVGIYQAASVPPNSSDRSASTQPLQVPDRAKTLLTGSHFDTVRNAGKYDGRLGIFVPMACVRELHRQGKRLPFNIEVVGFAEEEGQRYKATFLGSGALIGDFKPAWLAQKDANGITMLEAMQQAGLPGTLDAIAALKREADDYLGFVEVHIEQGPILNDRNLPLGIVTSINGSVRYLGEVRGMASHAGTTPMDTRRDAATAVAEIALFMEKRAAQVEHLVATMGLLTVPGGSINVVPGRCQFSLDIRATTDAVRDECASDVLAAIAQICGRRGVSFTLEETLRVPAAPSAPPWQHRWETAVEQCGLPVFRMPSGAGHDAMKLHEIMPQAMLFVRGENSGISHNPLESTTSHDIGLAIEAFQHLLDNLAAEH
jgi:beta-ureidopropionase / N-carbamoyl-L-amino-acid hydrolase